jgi:K+-transporting ATPase ATPase C chain
MNNDILSSFRPAIVMTALFALLLGVIYPLALTGIGQAVFPHQANGSLIEEGSIKGGGKLIGSELLAQGFTAESLFPPAPLGRRQGL